MSLKSDVWSLLALGSTFACHGEFLTAFGAPAREYLTTGRGLHARAKSMRTCAFLSLWFVGEAHKETDDL